MQRERAAWACLEHPNVVRLYGYTESSELFGSFGALISPVMRANALLLLLTASQWYKNGDAGKYLNNVGATLTMTQKRCLVSESLRFVA